MPILRPNHFRHHGRFYFSILCGVAVWLLLQSDRSVGTALGGTTFFVTYLATVGWVVRGLTPKDLRKKAQLEDEGILVIVLITLAAIALSLGSLALLLGDGGRGGWQLIPGVANVPLGWATLHMVMASHYARLFYVPVEGRNRAGRDTGGLDFPQTEEPGIGDFIYFSFVVGMTAQVSDVRTTSRGMRNAALVHGIVSFFFNAVIVAFAVNFAAQSGGQ